MFHVAFPRGQGPAFPDLPPTLQPCAVALAAPRPEHARAALLSSLIYLLLGAGLVVAGSTVHQPVPLPPLRTTPPYQIEIPGPPRLRLPESRSTQPARGGPLEATPVTPAPPVTATPPSEAPATLPTENHVGDHPSTASQPARPGHPGAEPAPGPGETGTAPRDFGATGLAILHQVEPIYPEFARQARIQGPVILRLTVDAQGQPTRVEVVEGHPAFHQAALQAARQWRFEPARVEGRPVPATFKLTLNFRLR